MDIHVWVFKLYGRFYVWQFEANQSLFNITVSIALFHFFYLPAILFTMNTIM